MIVKFFSTAFVVFFIAACAPFQGPGDMQGPGDLTNQPEYESEVNPPTDGDYYTSNIDEPKELQKQLGPFALSWPVRKIKLNRGYIQNPPHLGIDLGGRLGDAVIAAHDGYVVYKGRKFSGYGNMIILEYNQKWATLYAHLNAYNVKTGQVVRRGQVIGRMGRTGRATGVHLHFELIKDKQPEDPVPYLNSHKNFTWTSPKDATK